MQILEKRTYDARIFDINCSDLLVSGETITSVSTIISDQGGLTFGAATINSIAITYPDGEVAAIGKVMQFEISGGRIPAGTASLTCTVRARFATSLGNDLEATVLLKLTDRVD
jgi:hypothetical protein